MFGGLQDRVVPQSVVKEDRPVLSWAPFGSDPPRVFPSAIAAVPPSSPSALVPPGARWGPARPAHTAYPASAPLAVARLSGVAAGSKADPALTGWGTILSSLPLALGVGRVPSSVPAAAS